MWPADGVVAPAAISDGDRLILWPSMNRPGPIYVTTDPASGKLDYLVRRTPPLPGMVDKPPEEMKPNEVPPGPWDPGLLKDDDGRWYLYWDSSNVFPIYGIEIAFDDGKLIYKGQATSLFMLHPEQHGWERFGQDHNGLLANGQPTKPYRRGRMDDQARRRYYLQYGAPGTEFNVYANGTYVADKPLGPFKYADYNPIAYKPGGFVHGAGHGSTFEDAHGNWWNTGTPWIGYNWTFERRINMFPAKFEADGQFWSSSRFGDFPAICADDEGQRPQQPVHRLDAAVVSQSGDRIVDDGRIRRRPRHGRESADLLGRRGEPAGRDADARSRQGGHGPRGRRSISPTTSLAGSTMRRTSTPSSSCRVRSTGRSWQPLARTEPPRRDRPNAYFELPQPVRARFIRYVHGHVGAANLAISDIRVFGNADGARQLPRPSAVTGLAPRRPARCDDPLGARAGRGRLQYPLWHPA